MILHLRVFHRQRGISRNSLRTPFLPQPHLCQSRHLLSLPPICYPTLTCPWIFCCMSQEFVHSECLHFTSKSSWSSISQLMKNWTSTTYWWKTSSCLPHIRPTSLHFTRTSLQTAAGEPSRAPGNSVACRTKWHPLNAFIFHQKWQRSSFSQVTKNQSSTTFPIPPSSCLWSTWLFQPSLNSRFTPPRCCKAIMCV